jgi:hypothetical protein
VRSSVAYHRVSWIRECVEWARRVWILLYTHEVADVVEVAAEDGQPVAVGHL